MITIQFSIQTAQQMPSVLILCGSFHDWLAFHTVIAPNNPRPWVLEHVQMWNIPQAKSFLTSSDLYWIRCFLFSHNYLSGNDCFLTCLTWRLSHSFLPCMLIQLVCFQEWLLNNLGWWCCGSIKPNESLYLLRAFKIKLALTCISDVVVSAV